MPKLLDECESVENTLMFLALTQEQQAEVRGLPTEAEKRVRTAQLLADVAGESAAEAP